MPGDPPALTRRFLTAVELAAEVHGRQRRGGTQIPYLAHLLVVTGLVLEDGGDEDEAIAAMLHDAVEDGGGRPMLERIEAAFGPRVATIVEACSDTVDEPNPDPWRVRKERYLAHLPEVTDDGVLRVALADKVHNARSIVRDYREEGEALWERFAPRSVADQLWYYHGLLEFFEDRRPGPLTWDLRHAADELAALAAPGGTPTLYERAGGDEAFERLTAAFYTRVRADDLLAPVFAGMPEDHPHMLGKHLGLAITEERRARWAQLIGLAADDAGLPADPEFRSAFVAYIEWGTRLAQGNSQPGAEPPPEAPVPHWGWGEAPPYVPS